MEVAFNRNGQICRYTRVLCCYQAEEREGDRWQKWVETEKEREKEEGRLVQV